MSMLLDKGPSLLQCVHALYAATRIIIISLPDRSRNEHGGRDFSCLVATGYPPCCRIG